MDLSLTRQPLCKAITAFALDLYNTLNSDKLCKNVFFSPASISAALGMVLIGASGNTKTQIEKVSKTMIGFLTTTCVLLLEADSKMYGIMLEEEICS